METKRAGSVTGHNEGYSSAGNTESGKIFSLSSRERYLTQFVPLHKAALQGNWKAAEILITTDCSLVRTSITEGGETALHIAATARHAYFVANLLEKMEESEIEILNNNGNTALCFAAATGDVDIARLMVKKAPRLPTIRGDTGVMPLFMAALLGHSDMVDYLFPLSGFEFWTPDEQIALLTTSINSGLYDMAIEIVEQYQMLAVAKDSNGETPLHVLARKPSAFSVVPYMDFLSRKKLAEGSAYKLLDCLWDYKTRQEDIETLEFVGDTSKLLFVAAESGNGQFLVEFIRRYPDFLYKVDELKHSIFHIAISHRHVEAFNLIYEIGGLRDLIATYRDPDDNNMLHLAAKLAPQDQLSVISGAALQMHREILWYKEVEKIVQPSYRNMKNSNGQTPHELFIEEHKDLMKEGEKWMKQTAQSCMVVTTLIATVVFTTAFTVPGGYNNITGVPILLNDKLFMAFSISEAIAMLCSSASLLMFLSILTSRYAEYDFLKSLPFRLMIGVSTLFMSIAAMMVAFCTTCLLSYQHELAGVTILLGFFASVPIMFISLKYPLVVDILDSTYSSRWLFGSRNRLFP